MKLVIKQKFLSFLDSFNVYDLNGNIVYKVKSKFNFSHHYVVYDRENQIIGELSKEVFALLYRYRILKNGKSKGEVVRKCALAPTFNVLSEGYEVKGDILNWKYNIYKNGKGIAIIEKSPQKLSDAYVIDSYIEYMDDIVLLVLAIDAARCQR